MSNWPTLEEAQAQGRWRFESEPVEGRIMAWLYNNDGPPQWITLDIGDGRAVTLAVDADSGHWTSLNPVSQYTPGQRYRDDYGRTYVYAVNGKMIDTSKNAGFYPSAIGPLYPEPVTRRMSDADLANAETSLDWIAHRLVNAPTFRSAIGWTWLAGQIQGEIDREMRRRKSWWRR